ncbi:RME1 [Candida theae]|uniref:RME1 n=1 Tax=Candida theae TaxID=1198502 RepID=A0AAD5BDY8_9ASCO|nr:RME1 [Candida theae]KAI5957558.1 RME1 [Candida theae]
MSPLAAIWQSYHSNVKKDSPVSHSEKNRGSLPSLSIDEVVVRVSSVENGHSLTCQSAILLNELIAHTPKPQTSDVVEMSQVRPVSVIFGTKDNVSIGFPNPHHSQSSTSFPNSVSGFKSYTEDRDKSKREVAESPSNPSSSQSLASANTVVSSLPVSQMYQNPHKALEQSQLSQIGVASDLYSLVEQDLRYTPALYRVSPFEMDVDADMEESHETGLYSICPKELQSNSLTCHQPAPIHLKLKRGLLDNIQNVFNQTIDDDNEGVLDLTQQEGSTIRDCVMAMSAPPSTSPRHYSLSRLSTPQLNKLSMFKFATTPAPPNTFETPVAPKTTPVSHADVSSGDSPLAQPEDSDYSDEADVGKAISTSELTAPIKWTDSSQFYNGATLGVEASRLEDYKKAFFDQYTKSSICKIKMTESDKKYLSKDESKGNYYTMINNLDIFTCTKFATTRKFKCPVKECPMHFLGIKKRAELKHHVHYEHLKNGFVKYSCHQYENEIKSILFICSREGCGKAFYRCDSLNRHLNLVHGNCPAKGVKRKVVIVDKDEIENADVANKVASYEVGSDLDSQAIAEGEVCSRVSKRSRLSN